MTIDSDRTRAFVQRAWDDDIVPALTDYIRIPAKSPMYDPKWAEHGHIDRAVTLIVDWARRRKIEGLKIDVQIPANSLPRLFRPSLESFSKRSNCLIADSAATVLRRREFTKLGEGLKVGIAAGSDHTLAIAQVGGALNGNINPEGAVDKAQTVAFTLHQVGAATFTCGIALDELLLHGSSCGCDECLDRIGAPFSPPTSAC